MKKIIFIFIGLIVVFTFAVLFFGAVGAINNKLSACGPFPDGAYPYPFDPCAVRSSCGFEDIYNAPLPRPWFIPTGDLAVCRVVTHDSGGYWVFDEDGCKEGSRCVLGMFKENSTVTITGPENFWDVQLWGTTYTWLPIGVK